MQQCADIKNKKRVQAFANISKTVDIPGERFFDGEYLCSDYTFIKQADTTWLGEYLPYLNIKKPIKKQIEEMVKREFGHKAPIDKLFEAARLMEQKGFGISLSELGIAKKLDDLIPVILF